MVQFTSPHKPRSITQTVAKKHLKLHVKRLREREYLRLRAMVPSIATKTQVSKVTVIEEAVKYIDELHKALAARLQSKGLDSVVNEGNVKEFIHSVMPPNFLQKPPSEQYEKRQTVPSYLLPRKNRGLAKPW